MFAAVLLLLFAPPVFAGASTTMLAPLFVETLLLAATFLAIGLAAGFSAHDRAQALIIGVSVWLFLLIGVDMIALFAARWPLLQRVPDLWAALLMLNPLDAFRIEALFALQQIPAEAANKTPLASWWTAHAGLWFAIIAVISSSAALMVSRRQLERWEE
jgi:ABC-type transport system involved in multi-copper enzyme maturation permease subunit